MAIILELYLPREAYLLGLYGSLLLLLTTPLGLGTSFLDSIWGMLYLLFEDPLMSQKKASWMDGFGPCLHVLSGSGFIAELGWRITNFWVVAMPRRSLY